MLARQLEYPDSLINVHHCLTSKILHTDAGIILVEGPVAPDAFEKMHLHPGLKSFREADKQHRALVGIAALKEGRIFLARIDDMIVGYVTFHPPDEFERWGKGFMPCLIELGGIEVAPKWRGYGLSSTLLDIAFSGSWVEDNTIFATEYYWHWDLKGTGLSVWQYRDMMGKLFNKVGLEGCSTDDPDICSHAANMLMVRRGKRVSHKLYQQFQRICVQGIGMEWLV
ncbi:GNAT family N-acetyltransferase [Metallumcola ferriviriculae]|uniref:GNAT family N-acetyltransferase n=1 Tax=Metallumcola ferriviriculae TaxID=3039180 RepID=A0AAU0UIK7_9FIRM|nr:GNAT family N-acetyltransferase [Desulfitibacteraceae bacterium MK1]